MADNTVQSPPFTTFAAPVRSDKSEKTEYDITGLSIINACQFALIASLPIWALIGYILFG